MKLYTVKVVAAWLDLTEARVRQLRKAKIITEYQPGLYELKTVTHEYINYLRKNSPAEDSVDYNTERAKLVRAKRESQELELKLRKNELHETEEIERVMTDTLIKFKSKLMAIPAKQSPVLSKKRDQTEIFKLLKAAVDEALEELADFQKLFGYTEDDEKENC
ncbi:MAG: hypothetical protein K2P21_03565 [Lachnospiraceae bacterium]|nr:hypothetical protein [Lachnospiraceae bacterium]